MKVAAALGLVKTAEEGAATTLAVVFNPKFQKITGKYFADEMEWNATPFTDNEKEMDLLWKFSEKIIENHSF